MPLPRSLLHLGVLVPVALTLVSGCGDDGVTPRSESLPACTDVWVAGGILPADYSGCVGDDDVLEVSEIRKCSSAGGSFTTFGGTFFAILGQEISDAGPGSAEYDRLHQECFATGW
jgi:hypothetical protein